MCALVKDLTKLLLNIRISNSIKNVIPAQAIHTTNAVDTKWNKHNTGPQKWLEYNKQVFPPQQPHEEPRKAFVCHMKTNFKYSPLKMWYVAAFVRGMSVDEAVKQLSFLTKKGAKPIRETILEAQEMAVARHNVEFKSNLWVAESFVGKGRVFKGVRRHGRGRFGRVEYKHVHYFVRLEEGPPPKHYYLPYPKTPEEQFDEWMESMRRRKIVHSL